MTSLYGPLAVLLSILSSAIIHADGTTPTPIGTVEHVYTLASDNTEVRGLAYDESSAASPRLFVLDRAIHEYEVRSAPNGDELRALRSHALPADATGTRPANPRGLTHALENGRSVLYFLNWAASPAGVTSQLWRHSIEEGATATVDLSLYPFRIGDREVLGVAQDRGDILVCFDTTGYRGHDDRVSRGIIRLRWNPPRNDTVELVRHMPDSGHLPSRGLGGMELDGARYLWGTVGHDHIYCAEAVTGRGLFFFDRPRTPEFTGASRGAPASAHWDLSYGAGALWVSEPVPGKPDRVHRVNVARHLDRAAEGPRILRHLTMTITTRPEAACASPGKVYHHFSRPYANDQIGQQGTWPETEKAVDSSGAENATVKCFTHDPGGDVSSRQHMITVEYADAPSREYSSQYEIDLWTQPFRKYVYPHRARRATQGLTGTDYLHDDPDLYNLGDERTYSSFFDRVKAHIERKYGVAADLENPYWAARNALEYIQDSYYYPVRAKRRPATVDYDRKHYDANPGNLKIELSGRPYDRSQIIACSGTSVMMTGAMRHLGIPARWLGTGTEQGAALWDENGNGILDRGERAPCTNGHRYTQVWLGDDYGWICFDATPSRPDLNDFDPPPPLQPQWRYMNRAAAGHMKERRIVFNVGSGMFRPLYREFEYDEKLAVNNNCGGDQRYNIQGRVDDPARWALPRHRIHLTNICFIREVELTEHGETSEVRWELDGSWDRDPAATVSVHLQQMNGTSSSARDLATLARAIPAAAGSVAVDLSGHRGKRLRIMIRKEGDVETGGHSGLFDRN